jgi:serine/threonine protein phosphatase 1
MHSAIRQTISDDDHAPESVVVVRMGDYIDRGPDSLGVLDVAMDGLGEPSIEEINLYGNHDSYLLEVATREGLEPFAVQAWVSNGGARTLAQLGVALDDRLRERTVEVQHRVRSSLGRSRLEFLESLDLTHRVGDYVLAHAGIDPARDLDDQPLESLLLVRGHFLDAGSYWTHPVTVVHGHSIGKPSVERHRIGVDSAAYFTGALTAVQIINDRLRFIVVADHAVDVDALDLPDLGDDNPERRWGEPRRL